ncbi:MAG: exodeoxyribonuclease V subunit gamma [Oscillospiraceae bacterium]|nr:exodeoxyribonuclease V subunit gamma [Oscillospiraceae bacterium]
MMLKLLLGKDWTANRDEILRQISEDVRAGRGGRILMVPELISHDTERRLCAAAGDTASRFAEVLSFTRLARRVADSVGFAAEECLDDGGRVVAMAAAARQLHSRLKSYASVETRPEFLTDLVDAVDEFKRCCISSGDLLEASQQAEGSFAQKLEELSLLLDAYDGLCSQGKRDPRDQMTWLLEQMEDGDFAEKHVFYIDGFPDFTRQHLAILEHLIQDSPCVTVSLNCDQVDSTAMAFEKAGNTAAELIRCAQRAGVEVRIETVDEEPDPMQAVREKLFQGKLEVQPQLQGRLKLYRSDTPYGECQAAAEEILQLVRSGCRYRDVAVVCTDMATYQPLIELVFHRCGIPVYLSGTEDILQKSVVVTVLSAMDAALGGFDQRDVLRYLKSVLSPLDQDTCDKIENYAILWGIRGDGWRKEWMNHPDGLGAQWTEAAQHRLDELNEARSLFMEPLMTLRQGFQSASKLEQQVLALYHYLEDIRLADRLSRFAEELDGAGDNRSAQILNQLWEILLTALEQLHDVLGETVWDADIFTRLFSLLLSQYDVGTIPPVLDAVTVGPVSAMRCQQEKQLIVLGAQEGNLPGYGGSKGVLTDQERVALREMGVPLTGGAMEGLQAEFAEIYGVFCGATEAISVYCSAGQPSFVYRRLATMAGGELNAAAVLGPALSDKWEAGAYLASWQAADEAKELDLIQSYQDTLHRSAYDLGSIERENVRKLYGQRLELSASQVDRQAECRLSYFLKYGLRAKELKEATVDPAEFGTYIHAILEETAREVHNMGGFHVVSLEQTMEIAERYADKYAQERFGQMDSRRLDYLFRRNGQELEMVLRELWQELHLSEFEPADFEVAFGDDGKLPAIPVPGSQMDAILRGFVDRVDTWLSGGNHYFRVVDYKTGKKDFDYCDVFNGVGLQMLLYLFALEEAGEDVVGTRPVPAGVQYFPARAPLVSSDGRLGDEEAQQARVKEWKRRGLLLQDEAVLQAMEPGEYPTRLCCTRKKDGTLSGDLADRDQLKLLRKYIFRVLGNMVDEIASGKVEPNPYTRGSSHDACAFCPYGAVCHQASVEGRRNYKAMTAQRFWEEIGKEMNHG